MCQPFYQAATIIPYGNPRGIDGTRVRQIIEKLKDVLRSQNNSIRGGDKS